MTSMFVPEPVMSLAITPKKSKKGGGSDTNDKFSKVGESDSFRGVFSLSSWRIRWRFTAGRWALSRSVRCPQPFSCQVLPHHVSVVVKAFARFTKEDPTLRVHTDDDSKQTIVSGMGELHLEVYVERLR